MPKKIQPEQPQTDPPAGESAMLAELAKVEADKNKAYGERNRVVAALARCALALGYPAWLGRHSEGDAAWERDWMSIVYVRTSEGQVSFHIHDSELSLFADLPRHDEPWDGHTTDEKFARLEAWRPEVRRT